MELLCKLYLDSAFLLIVRTHSAETSKRFQSDLKEVYVNVETPVNRSRKAFVCFAKNTCLLVYVTLGFARRLM